MVPHLKINSENCIGCGLCVSVCIRENLAVENGKLNEVGGSRFECFECGHCTAICPNNCIKLLNVYGDVHEYDSKERLISPDIMEEFLIRRRSCRWFTDSLITKEEFEKILSPVKYSETAENTQKIAFVIIDNKIDDFMHHLRFILGKRRGDYARFDQFCKYVDEGMKGNNPLIWEGKQIILAFSKLPIDAVLAIDKVEMMAYSMGFGGFHSKWIQMAEEIDHTTLMEFFPDIPSDYGMNSVFVIGKPRTNFKRTVPRKDKQIVWM